MHRDEVEIISCLAYSNLVIFVFSKFVLVILIVKELALGQINSMVLPT